MMAVSPRNRTRAAIWRLTRIAEQPGIRAMLTQPTDEEAARFCARFGFITPPLRGQDLLQLLTVARRVIR
jgi:hypothetical protein